MFQSDPSGQRLGPFWFTPGWTRGNAGTIWLASFFTIGLAAFMSIVQPYLLTEVLHVPAGEQGTLTGTLGFAQEIVTITLAGLIGTWSDRVGRRRVYYLGFVMMGLGYFIYPFATSTSELFVFRLAFAIGVAMAPLMLSACVVDAIQEPSRGRWIGSNNILQGLGVVIAAAALARTPAIFHKLGADPVAAARYAYWTAGGLCLLAALVMAIGLPRAAPAGLHGMRSSLVRQLQLALRTGTGSPRLSLAYGAAFIGRGDFTILGAFFSLWLTQVGIESGLSPAASVARGGMLFGILQLGAMAWAFAMGFIVDRVDRVTGLCIALSIASAAYLLLGNVSDPLGRGFIPVVLLVGAGEISVIVASGALLGQEVPRENRGSIVGFYNAVGGLGILFATYVGGRVFDGFGRTAPFTMMGILNAVLLVAALITRFRGGQPAGPTTLAPGHSQA